MISLKCIYFALRRITQELFALNLQKDPDKFPHLVFKTAENGVGSLVCFWSFDWGIQNINSEKLWTPEPHGGSRY